MTLLERQCLHTERIGLLLGCAKALGMKVKVVEWNRLLSTQKEYVAAGKSKTLASTHLDNCGTDIYVVAGGRAVVLVDKSPESDNALYRQLGAFWESLGGRWGGRFGLENQPAAVRAVKIGWDPYHFETPDA